MRMSCTVDPWQWLQVRRSTQRVCHSDSKGGRMSARAWFGAATLCVFTALGCGDERPPWTGFDLFPPDAGGFDLPPELESSLRAAQAAFFAQLAAEQGIVSTEATAPATASAGLPSQLGNGVGANEIKSEQPGTRDEENSNTNTAAPADMAASSNQSPAQPDQHSNALMDAGADGYAGVSGSAHASGTDSHSEVARLPADASGFAGRPTQPSEPELDVPTSAGGSGGYAGIGGAIGEPQPSTLDGGTPPFAGEGGDYTGADSDGDQPMRPPEPDAGTEDDGGSAGAWFEILYRGHRRLSIDRYSDSVSCPPSGWHRRATLRRDVRGRFA